MRANNSTDFNKTKKNYIDTAKDLCYDDNVIKKLEAANTEIELDNIMIGARKRWD